MSVREDYQRARSEAEKLDRRNSIVAAADELFRTSAPDDVTMNDVARAVGIAKGTLYSYFATKEELLLVLYQHVFAKFCARMRKGVRAGMSDEAFIKLIHKCAHEDPRVLSLGSILTTVIERNVPVEAFVEGKRNITTMWADLATFIEPRLNLKEGQGIIVIRALAILLLGAVQHDISPHVEMRKLPDDVAAMIRASNAEEAFFTTAALVMKGLRA